MMNELPPGGMFSHHALTAATMQWLPAGDSPEISEWGARFAKELSDLVRSLGGRLVECRMTLSTMHGNVIRLGVTRGDTTWQGELVPSGWLVVWSRGGMLVDVQTWRRDDSVLRIFDTGGEVVVLRPHLRPLPPIE